MTAWIAVLAAVGVAVLVVEPPRRIGPRSGGPGETGAAPGRSGAAHLPAWLLVPAGLGAAALLLRPGWVGPVVAGSLLAVTLLLVLRNARRHRARARHRASAAEACAVLAAGVRVGMVPGEALAAAARDCPVLAEAATARELGGDPAEVLSRCGRVPGAEPLAELGRAWRLCERTGAPMGQMLLRVAEGVRREQATDDLVAAELAAPRLSGRMLAVLPLVGLGLGAAIGGDPVGFLLGGTFGAVCLVVGVGLACAGVLWTERIADEAGRLGRSEDAA